MSYIVAVMRHGEARGGGADGRVAKRLAPRHRDKNHLQDIRAISAVGIFMNARPRLPAILFRFYSLYRRPGRGQKTCFTKREICADGRLSREGAREREKKSGRGHGLHGVENEPRGRSSLGLSSDIRASIS